MKIRAIISPGEDMNTTNLPRNEQLMHELETLRSLVTGNHEDVQSYLEKQNALKKQIEELQCVIEKNIEEIC